MYINKGSITGLIFLSGCLISFMTHAQSVPQNNQSRWLIGGGLVASANPYTDMDDEVQAVPFVSYQTGNFSIGFEGVSYQFNPDEGLEIKILGEIRMDSYDPDESNRFDSIDRDSTLEAGFAINKAFGNYIFKAKALTDILDEHNGNYAKLSAGVKHTLGKGGIELSVGAIYRSDDLNLYLYGVAPEESTASLDAFATDSGWSGIVEASYVRPLSKQSILRAGVSVESLDSDVKDSPRVDSSSETRLQLIWIWMY